MPDGREVWHEPRGLAAGYDWPQIAIHRGRLQFFLLDELVSALGSDSVRFGHALGALESSSSAADIGFVDRATGRPVLSAQADVVSGADGIHSAVRKRFYPSEGIPKWNGISLFRGTTTLPAGSVGPAMNWTGYSRQKFVGYPISVDATAGEYLFNGICDLQTAEPGATPREDWNRKVDPSTWLPRFAGWRWPGIDVVSIVSGAKEVYEFPMVEREAIARDYKLIAGFDPGKLRDRPSYTPGARAPG